MSMLNYIFIGIMSSFLYSFIFSKILLDEKMKLKLFSLLSGLVIGFISYFVAASSIPYIRPILLNVLLIVYLYLLYKKSLSKTILSELLIFFGMVISELIFSIIIRLLFSFEISWFKFTDAGMLTSNIIIYLISLMIFNVPKIKKFLRWIIKWQDKNTFKTAISLYIFILFILTFFIYQNFSLENSLSYLILSNVFFVVVIILIIVSLKEKTDNNKLKSKYSNLINYSKVYEKTINEKSKNQHEYKNQLIIIDDMILPSNKKAKEYIRKLLNKEEYNQDEELISKLKNIPVFGLKGFIYYKIEQLRQENTDVFVNVAENFSNKKLWSVCDKYLDDISMLLGVYMDNAIEECIKSTKKYFILDIYLEDDKIVFKICNTFNGNIDVDKIDQEKYSTKGKNRGYGLSLAKDILSKNNLVSSEREINGIYYIQKMIIETK